MATSWVRGASLNGTVWHTRRTQVAASGSRLMRILELCRHPLGQPAGLQEAPEKDVCVGEELHDRKASHSLSGTGGETMSPVILPVALKEPNQEAGFFGGGDGAPRRRRGTRRAPRRARPLAPGPSRLPQAGWSRAARRPSTG